MLPRIVLLCKESFGTFIFKSIGTGTCVNSSSLSLHSYREGGKADIYRKKCVTGVLTRAYECSSQMFLRKCNAFLIPHSYTPLKTPQIPSFFF